MHNIRLAIGAAAKSLYRSTPILLGVVLLIGLVHAFIPPSLLQSMFTGIEGVDAIIGAVFGSILAGNPITSYVLGGELLKHGVSLTAVTAFLVAWVTVGIVQLPAESAILGSRFAIVRNVVSFVLSIVVAILTVFILGVVL